MKANIFKSASVSLRSRPAAGGAGTSGSGGSGNPASSGGGSIRGKPISNPIPIPNALDADGFPPPIRLGIHGASGHSTGSPQPAAEGGAAYGDAPAGVTSEPQLHEQQLYHPPPPVSQQLGGGGGGSGSRTEVESPSAAAVADRGSGGSPRRRTAQHVLNRYSAVSTSTAPTDGTGGSSGAGAPPKRKKSTLRSAIGRLFGRAGSSGRKKSQSSADGGDGAGGEGSAAAGLGQAALNRSVSSGSLICVLPDSQFRYERRRRTKDA